MKKIYLHLAVLFTFLTSPLFSQLPFTIEMEETTFQEWPGLHSFAFGEYDGKWVFLTGRTNGLHGFFPFTGFPVSEANDKIWVMDVETGEVWDWDVAGFSDEIAGPLLSSNPQFAQRGKHLYVAGGYGKDMATEDFITWPTLLSVDLEMLVAGIIDETDPEAAFRLLTDERMRVCGGEMALLGEDFYLVGGHDFAGLYNSSGSPTFTQSYTSEIRRFRIADDGVDFSIENYEAFEDPEFHRRDGSLAPLFLPDGTAALGFYGGVFQPDADLPFQYPIYISPGNIEVDDSYFQKMSQYTCPVLPMFDEENGTMYSTFFGGISLHHKDGNNELVSDSLMPFINEVSVFVRHADGTSEEVVTDLEFDELLGTNAKFILSPDAPHFDNKVLKLNDLQGRTMVGYIYGGIKALIPNITPSEGSDRLFKIYIEPIISPTKKQTPEEVHAYVFPNPFSGRAEIRLPENFHPSEISISNLAGETIWQLQHETVDELMRQAALFLENTQAGIYFLKMDGKGKTGRVKVVKMRR